MNKFIVVLAAGAVAISSGALAQAATDAGLASAPAAEVAAQTSQTSATELKDGSKVEISPTGMVSVFTKEGTKTAAPDGELTLKDGTTINVKDGKKV